jgi:carbamoyl-phosphate synthase large subunit
MNVLLTCAGRRNYLVQYFREALELGEKVVATNTVADTPAMQAADVAIKVPASHDPSYIPTLLNICREQKIKLMLSLHDLDTTFLSLHLQKFIDIGVIPVISEPEFINICFDKFLMISFLKAQGFGSIGLFIARDQQDVSDCYRLLRKTIVNTPIVNSPNFNMESCIMFQQFIEGEEYGVDVINDLNGKFISAIIEKKLSMRSGETDSAIIVDDTSLSELGQIIGLNSRHMGLLDIDVIMKNATPYIIEMNPRFGGHYPFAHIAGANVPAAIIAWAKGCEPNPLWLKAEVGIKGFKELVPTRVLRK